MFINCRQSKVLEKYMWLYFLVLLKPATLLQRNSFRNSDFDKIFTYVLQFLRTQRAHLFYKTFFMAACEIRTKTLYKSKVCVFFFHPLLLLLLLLLLHSLLLLLLLLLFLNVKLTKMILQTGCLCHCLTWNS